MKGIRISTWLILLALAIPLGWFVWPLSGQLGLGPKFSHMIGGLTGILIFWVVNLNERRIPVRTALPAIVIALMILWLLA